MLASDYPERLGRQGMPDGVDDALIGGCQCGRVRFRMEVAPIITHCCHCRDCQKASGSAFGINAMIETSELTLVQGEVETIEREGSHTVVRCPECACRLWVHLGKLGNAIALVGVGVLDAGERLPPEAHYFVRSKHPWITVPSDVPSFDELGDPGKPGAAGRIMAVLGTRSPGPQVLAPTDPKGDAKWTATEVPQAQPHERAAK
jgi:hypothetical protein